MGHLTSPPQSKREAVHKRAGLPIFEGLVMWFSDQDAAVRKERVAEAGPETAMDMWLLKPCHNRSRFLWTPAM